MVRTLRTSLVVIFASLFVVAFWESWERLADAARLAKVPHPGPWPWSVDGFILVMVLLVILALAEGRRPHLPRFGVMALTALSAAFSVLYTPEDAVGRWGAPYFVSAWPAVASWFSFEGLMWLLFGRGRVDAPATPDATATVDQTVDNAVASEGVVRDAPVDTEASHRETLTPVPFVAAASQIPAVKRRMIDARHAKQMSGKTIARETGVAERLVYAYLREQREPDDASVAGNGGVASHE